MIGPRIGVKVGVRPGPAIGVSDDPVAVGGVTMATVDQDATSLVYCPANATQAATWLSVAGISTGGPASIHLLQEASGNAADSVGGFTLTAGGTPTYQSAVTGWTRKGIAMPAGLPGILSSVSASLPDITSASCLLLAYVLLPAGPVANASLVTIGTPFAQQAAANLAAGATRAIVAASGANTSTGASDANNVVRPIVVQVNRTAGVVRVCTNLEQLAPTVGTMTGKAIALGGDNTQTFNAAASTYLWAVRFDGSAAEWSLANIRTALTTLGWSIPW